MGALNFSPRAVNSAIEEKVKPLRKPGGKENNAWYWLDGKKLFRITYSKVHSVAAVPPGTLNQIRNSLKLDKPRFADLLNCPMSGTDYETYIRSKRDAGAL